MREGRPRHNLPAQLTSFVGRERELAAVRRLPAERRLLTLVGAPGVGKTRLALEAAGGLTGAYPDGVWLVELAALADPALLPQTLAAALDVREQPGRELAATLVDVLQPRRLLLILDNCEHLVVACATLAERLLRACPTLTILATSREPLGIPGEATWPVPTLPVPPAITDPRPDEVAECTSVQLFVERARAVTPGFGLTGHNVEAVSQICRRVDGIPLAIELAAARVRGLAPDEIAARLDDRFQLLAGGGRTAPPRHRTLRSLVDWSYALLSEPERVLFRRLSVFAGGWTLDAAEEVCAGDGVEPGDVLDLLLQLVARSLVLADERAGHTRYRLLETLREYGLDKLREAGEEATLRDRQRDWCLALAEQAEPRLRGPDSDIWMGRLEAELDNLRAVLAWTRDAASRAARSPHPVEMDVEAGLRLAGALGWFWFSRGRLTEGRRWSEEILRTNCSGSATARISALNTAAILAARQRDRVAVALAEQALALSQSARDAAGGARALLTLANVAGDRGDHARAVALIEDALARYRSIGQTEGIQRALQNLGDTVRHRGDYERAGRLFEEALALARRLGDVWAIGMALVGLGRVAYAHSEYERAASLLEESISRFRELEAPMGLQWAVAYMGLVACALGDYARAALLFGEGLSLCRRLGDTRNIARGLENFTRLAVLQGQHERAARLLGAGAALREALGSPLSPAERAAGYDDDVAAAQAALGGNAFAAAWAEGATMPLEQAIDYALASSLPTAVSTGTATDRASRSGDSDAAAPLTAREQEVAALIARGLTNHRIAAELVVADRTVDAHVRNILDKLGFASRAQVAAWAAERGLTAPRPRAGQPAEPPVRPEGGAQR